MITYKVQVTEDSTTWYINGKMHREDGPAIEYSDGYKAWFVNGKLHREDGPAIEDSNDDKAWYINGVELTEADFNNRTAKPCNGKVIEVDGVKYKLTAV